MNQLNFRKQFLLGLLIASLAGCAGIKEPSTLKVLPDNRFMIADRADNGDTSYYLNKDKSRIYAYRVYANNGKMNDINIADIKGIAFDESGFFITLQDGSKLSLDYRGPLRVMTCDMQANCKYDFDSKNPGFISIHTLFENENVLNDMGEKPTYFGKISPIERALDSNSVRIRRPGQGARWEFMPSSTVDTFVEDFGKRDLAKRRQFQQQSNQQAEERRVIKEKAVAEREKAAAAMRKSIKIGTMTNCGQVFSVKLPMIGVQTINGMQYIDVSRLYPSGVSCKFINGVYSGVD